MAVAAGQAKPVITRAGFGFLALLLGFASISTDLYLPAMPTMVDALGTSHGNLELTISAYLFGFAVGQLFWGPFSDQRGRRLPLATGLVLFTVGAIGCGLVTNVFALILFRVIQALGASAAVVIGRAIVRDLFEGKDAAKVLSTLTAIMVIAPMIGPVLGARILAVAPWRTIFFVLAGVGVLTLVSLPRIIRETLPTHKRLPPGRIIDPGAYLALLGNKRLTGYALIVMVFTAGVFAYVAGSSFMFITHQGLSPDAFGVVFSAGSIAIMASNLANARLVGRFGSDNLMVFGLILGVIAAVALLLTIAMDGSTARLIIATVTYVGSNGFVSANAVSGGLNSVSTGVGRASALLGFAQYGGGMLGSLMLGLISNSTIWPMAVILAVTSAASLFLIFRVRQLPIAAVD